MNRVLAVLLLLPVLMLADPLAAQTAPMFRITVIDVPGNAVEGWRTVVINDDGVVASQVEVPKAGGQGRRRVLFRWTPGGVIEFGVVTDINTAGTTVGGGWRVGDFSFQQVPVMLTRGAIGR
jgi:hypothetical protein